MGALDGRVAIVTGAGRGLGRDHALLLAAEGASVVVNDLGGDAEGQGDDGTPAQHVVSDIEAAGGQAIASSDDVGTWEGGQRVVDLAVQTFGDLHVLVNNAGILRDRALVNMTEDDWDAVIQVHLKGHFVPTRWAARYWRQRTKAGHHVHASVVNTSSTSGLLGNPGQANYGAAKAGIAGFTAVCAMELTRYGVHTNCVVPAARTRLTEATPGLGDLVQPPAEAGQFDVWDPANASPLVAWLAKADCPVNGAIFFVQGGKVQRFEPWRMGSFIERPDRWTVADLDREMPALLG